MVYTPMNTKEFTKTLQDKNYCVEISDHNEVCILSADGHYIARVNSDYMGVFTIGINASQVEDESERVWLVDFIACFAKTPIDERDGKKYHIKPRWLNDKYLKYLCYDRLSYVYFLCEEPPISDEVTSEFTQEHINSIKRKFDTILEDFDIVEV